MIRRRLLWWIGSALVLAVALAPVASADPGACPGDPIVAEDSKPITKPSGYDKLVEVQAGTGSSWAKDAKLTGDIATADTWTPQTADAVKNLVVAKKGVRIVFGKTNDASATCEATVKLPAGGDGGDDLPVDSGGQTESVGTDASDFEACHTNGEAWEAQVAKQASKHTLIVFMQSGEVCYANRLHGIEGDPIYIGLYTEQSTQWKPIEFSPCSLEDAAPAIFVSTGKVSLASSGTQGETWGLIRGTPRHCYNASVDIKASSTNTGAKVAFTLPQYRLYRATVQLGVVYTDQHTSDFGVANDASGTQVIHDSATHGRGPEYVASLVVYGLPHYLKSLVSGPAYPGRDILHQQSWMDRIGLVMGVGLTEPTRRFEIGASFEVMYGINLIVTEICTASAGSTAT